MPCPDVHSFHFQKKSSFPHLRPVITERKKSDGLEEYAMNRKRIQMYWHHKSIRRKIKNHLLRYHANEMRKAHWLLGISSWNVVARQKWNVRAQFHCHSTQFQVKHNVIVHHNEISNKLLDLNIQKEFQRIHSVKSISTVSSRFRSSFE